MLKKVTALLLCLALAFALSACGTQAPVVTVDPYEGMVQVDSGFGSKIWVKCYDDVPVSGFDSASFRTSGGRVSYTGSGYSARSGVDVSEHQGEIDWAAVAADGIDFAMIRAGYRGYSQGGLYEDTFFEENIKGALENGVAVGVYFFSQAVTTQEAVEEADYLLDLIKGYDISCPVVFDWERIDDDEARTDDVDGAILTDCAIAFCERVRQAGYTPCIYTYRYLGYFTYELPRLTDYTLWVGAIGSSPDFYYRHSIWQYSIEGKVSGIDGAVDLNIMFAEGSAIPVDGSSPETSAPLTETPVSDDQSASAESFFIETTAGQ